MKKTDISKKFDYGKFEAQVTEAKDFTGLNKGNNAVVVRASDLDNEAFQGLVEQMVKDTRKGLAIYFNKGEEIYFPPTNKQIYRFDGFEIYNGELRIRLSVSAYCERYGEFFFPMSLTRRVPNDEPVEIDGIEYPSGLTELLKENPLGSQLIRNTLSDLDRCKLVADSIVTVTDKLRLTQYEFELQGDRMVRTDRTRKFTCYKFK